jgi:transposase
LILSKCKEKKCSDKEILDRKISPSAAIRLQIYLNLINYLDDEIEVLEREIFNYANQKHKREIEILLSVQGIGEIDAATLIAERKEEKMEKSNR